MKKDQAAQQQLKTPFFSALVAYAASNVTPFDVPGHRMGIISNEFTGQVGLMTMKMDVNAPIGMDNLNLPRAVIKESQDLFAKAGKAKKAYFLVNSTTSGILAMISHYVKEGEKIILPRNVHKSVISALIISGAVPIFITPAIDRRLGIAQAISLAQYQEAINAHPDAVAVFVINPNYFGTVVDLKGVVDYAHAHYMKVLVDEAHGSHFYFSPNFPRSAMAVGADVSCISMHKTGGSLTQSAVMLSNDEEANMLTTIRLFQSTSPSNLLIASLDVARKMMYFEGPRKLPKLLELADLTRQRINAIPGLYCPDRSYFLQQNFDYDPTKLIVDVSALKINGQDACLYLKREFNVQMELGDADLILAVLTIGTTETHLAMLVEALTKLGENFYHGDEFETYDLEPVEFINVISPRQAYIRHHHFLDYQAAIGQVAAEMVMAYPPGIPFVIPGEIITTQLIDMIKYYQENGFTIIKDHDQSNQIAVVKMEEQ